MREIVLLHHPLVIHQVKIVAAIPGLVHEDVGFCQLSVILVGCHHKDIKTLFVGTFGNGTDHIICLKTGYFQDWDVVRADNFLDDRDGAFDVLGRCFTLRLVCLKLQVAECRSRRIKCHSNMGWIFLTQHLFQGVHKTEDGRCVQPLGINPRVSYKGIVGAINERVGVEKEKFVFIHNHLK